MSSVLEGIRVLDFGRYIAGPYCATLLADMGADVIRVERPVIGSEDRWVSPIASGGEGALFMQMNRNKRCITLNPKKPEGREIVRKLVARADVVVANLPPQTLEETGLDYPTLRQTKDDIILTTVSAFGHGGPYSNRVGFDGIAQAMSGAMYLSGDARGALPSLLPVGRLHHRDPHRVRHHGGVVRAAEDGPRPAGRRIAARLGAQHRERHPDRAGGDLSPTAWRRRTAGRPARRRTASARATAGSRCSPSASRSSSAGCA